MARRRSVKAKEEESVVDATTDVAETPEAEEPERVTVVTEVVETDEKADSGPEVATSVASADMPTEETVETKMEEPEKEPVAPPSRGGEKPKDVVEGLFRRDTPTVTPEITIHKENKRLPLGLWIAIVVVVAALVGGGLLWATGSGGGVKLPSIAKATPTPTAAPTPTPAPTVSRSDITIQVLNGGGTPGAAGRMKTFLEDKGWTVSDTGNTEEYTYETTDIVSKPGKEAYVTLLQDDLKSDYTLGSVSATLATDATYDVQVIVGKGE